MDIPTSTSVTKALLPTGASAEEIAETLAIFESTGIEVLMSPKDSKRFPRLSTGPKWDHLTLLGSTQVLESPRVIGIVGRRDPSDRGLQFAHDVAECLGQNGVPTISGNARGIDRAAHQGSLCTGTATVSVVPEGILRLLHRRSQPSLTTDFGSSFLVISGVSPWERWSVGEAMRRNRWIANWCDALIVVEANLEGGTWRTAEAAAKCGTPIWVCTGFEAIQEDLGNEALAKTFRANRLDIGTEVEEVVSLVMKN